MGRRSSVTARDMVPQGYVVFADLRDKTARQCERADARNVALHRKRLDLSAVAAKHGHVALPVEPPPSPTNLERRQRWHRNNKPVPALAQARAVEALLERGLRVGVDYEPEDAIQRAALPPTPPPPRATTDPNFWVIPDDRVAKVWYVRCLVYDVRNGREHTVAARRSRSFHRRARGVIRTTATDPGARYRTNCYRRAVHKARSLEQSALLQAEAVEYLWDHGLRVAVGYDPLPDTCYEAQNAITEALSRRQVVEPTAPSAPPPDDIVVSAHSEPPPPQPEPEHEPESKAVPPLYPYVPDAPAYAPASHRT